MNSERLLTLRNRLRQAQQQQPLQHPSSSPFAAAKQRWKLTEDQVLDLVGTQHLIPLRLIFTTDGTHFMTQRYLKNQRNVAFILLINSST
jgi:hypothetical protein